MSGGAKLNGFLIWLDQGGALVFTIFGFHRIAARPILLNGQNKSPQLFTIEDLWFSGPLTKYDETYVRKLLSRITVFEDRLVFTFKDGKEVTIKE